MMVNILSMLLLRYCYFWPSCSGIKQNHGANESWGLFIMSQRADLSWRRSSSCSKKVSCRLKVNVHPCVGTYLHLIDRTFGQGQWECVGVWVLLYVCVCGDAAVSGAVGPMSNNPSLVFHSGPASGGWWLISYAAVESNRYRHILLLTITLYIVDMWKIRPRKY